MFAHILQVTNSSAVDDFLSVSNTALFSEGQSTATGTLVLLNDVIPEGNETFVVEIVDTRFGAEPGSQTTLLLTVLASDEPHGRISFDEVWVTGNAYCSCVNNNPRLCVCVGVSIRDWVGTFVWSDRFSSVHC